MVMCAENGNKKPKLNSSEIKCMATTKEEKKRTRVYSDSKHNSIEII